jgi:hypothetical protein
MCTLVTTDTAAAKRPPLGTLREQNLRERNLLCAM